MLWTAPPPAHECQGCGCCKASHDPEEPTRQAVTTIGLDIAKSVFQVHGIDPEGKVLIRRKLKRAEFERGQEQARQYQQARRSLSAQLVHRQGTCSDPLRNEEADS